MSPRDPWRFFAALFLLVVNARADVKVGDAFPALDRATLVSLSGGTPPTLAGKVTLVDFWASWCAPCKASFPAMARLHEEFAARGLQIVAVGIDEKSTAAVAFWKKQAPPFSGVHDQTQSLVQSVAVPTMPTSYLLDRTGHVRFIHAGFHGEVAELHQEIETLLAEKN